MGINVRQDSPDLALSVRFEIDPTGPSGIRWKTKERGYKHGDSAGSKNTKGYWKVGKAPHKKWLHRVVYELTHGPLAVSIEIDHIDGNPSNNHPGNLRACTHGENNQNRYGSASYGWYPKGININSKTGRVQGIIGKDGKPIRPGKGFSENQDTSSIASNVLMDAMRCAIEGLHGPYANTDSYYCQLPDEAVLGSAEGVSENGGNLGETTSIGERLKVPPWGPRSGTIRTLAGAP